MLVTCLTPITEKRRAWTPQIIKFFESQTHVDRELLFVADGEWIEEFCDCPGVRFVFAQGVIGTKRNIGVRFADGEVICHFDSDDYYAPGYVADQVARLQSSGKAVTGYHAALFTDGRGWWRKYHGPKPFFAFGASLCYRRQWAIEHPFPDLQSVEDGAFTAEAAELRQLTAEDAGELFIASKHADNTSKRPTDAPCWLRVPEPPKYIPFKFFV